MPKHDFFSPKAIGNRIKSVGLQRLRWYCQMCEKQCRDENGFKCHMSSESHLRQMRIFADNPNRFLSDFSRDFEKGFLDILSHRHGTKRVKANQVYQEYIADKQHIHMNATQWTSLSGFVQHLGREGKVVADDTEKGWFIQFIDRDPKLIAKQQELQEREEAELAEEERQKQIIQAQIIAAAKAAKSAEDEAEDKTLDESHERVAISLPSSKRPRLDIKTKRLGAAVGFGDDETTSYEKSDQEISYSSAASKGTSMSTMDEIMREEERKKQKIIEKNEALNRKEYWLHEGIVVKIINKEIASKHGSLYGEKGTVIQVVDKYGGDISLNNGTIVRLDQQDVETVVPKVGSKVLIVNGAGRGSIATLLRINESTYNCDIRIEEGPLQNMELKVAYEDFSKITTVV